MKKIVISVIAMVAVLVGVISLSGCASCSRSMKSFGSNMDGGLDRTVTVYDYNGDVLGQWSGKFDISNNDNEIFFDDENNKRVIIQNGIVIAEEN